MNADSRIDKLEDMLENYKIEQENSNTRMTELIKTIASEIDRLKGGIYFDNL